MWWLLFISALAQVPNGDFSAGEVGATPSSWVLPAATLAAGIEAELTAQGTMSVRSPAGPHWGTVMTTVEGASLRGKRVRLSARVRVHSGEAQLWLREDPEEQGQPYFFDNMDDRPLPRGEWREVQIVGALGEHTQQLALGVLVRGRAQVEVDDVSLEVLGEADEGNEPARPLRPGELEGLIALAKLGGVVEYFHPTDAVLEADWTATLTEAVRRLEASDDLLSGLQAAFADIAPAVQLWGGGEDPGAPRIGGRVTTVEHVGLGALFNAATGALYPTWGPYTSSLRRSPARRVAPADQAVVLELGGGLWARVPLALSAEVRAAGDAHVRVRETPPEWKTNPRDRSSRLAAVLRTWAVFEHFYPYWDAVDASWDDALASALTEASEQVDLRATLARLVAASGDGHGGVYGGGWSGWSLPVELLYTERGLTVSRVLGDAGLEVGDLIIDAELLQRAAALRRETAGATEQWLDHRVSHRGHQRQHQHLLPSGGLPSGLHGDGGAQARRQQALRRGHPAHPSSGAQLRGRRRGER